GTWAAAGSKTSPRRQASAALRVGAWAVPPPTITTTVGSTSTSPSSAPTFSIGTTATEPFARPAGKPVSTIRAGAPAPPGATSTTTAGSTSTSPTTSTTTCAVRQNPAAATTAT